VHRNVGWPLMATGTYLVVRSLAAAGPVDLNDPGRLVTSGPYAAQPHPM
jgi:hypothetical protein